MKKLRKLKKIPKQPGKLKKKRKKKKVKKPALPPGALDPARLRFLGQTLNYFYDVGFTEWVRIQSDGSLFFKRYDGTFGKVPLIVCCTRDRRFAYQYVKAVCANRPIPEDVPWQRDWIDKELDGILTQWEEQKNARKKNTKENP